MGNGHQNLVLIFSCKLFTLTKKNVLLGKTSHFTSHGQKKCIYKKNVFTKIIKMPFTTLYYHLLFKFIGRGGRGGGGGKGWVG